MRSKTSNDNYYLLTMAAIAQEIRYRRGERKTDVVLAAGLPLASFGREKKGFREYLFRKEQPLRKTGGLLEKKGYEVRVFDLINPDTSFCYNPFEYVHDDKDVLRLISNLIQNTTPKGSQSSDPFWEKSETALLQALMLYLLHEAPPEEQNFAMIMEMLGSAQVKEEDEDYESPLDILPACLEATARSYPWHLPSLEMKEARSSGHGMDLTAMWRGVPALPAGVGIRQD